MNARQGDALLHPRVWTGRDQGCADCPHLRQEDHNSNPHLHVCWHTSVLKEDLVHKQVLAKPSVNEQMTEQEMQGRTATLQLGQ